MIRIARIFAFIIGTLTLIWQLVQIVTGNAINQFLIPDLLLGIALVGASFLTPTQRGVSLLLAAFGFTAGVFAVATFGGLLTQTYDFGAFTTTIGLIPSTIFMFLLVGYIRSE